jgi:hypothetical protein
MPQISDFEYGWATDPDSGRYAYSYHRDRDVAAVYHGGQYVEVSVSGTWHPGQPLHEMIAYEALNTYSGDTGERMLQLDPEALTRYFMASGQAG